MTTTDDPRRRWVCAACGERRETASWPCTMSDDGEGDHDWVDDPVLTAEEADLLGRILLREEQGARER